VATIAAVDRLLTDGDGPSWETGAESGASVAWHNHDDRSNTTHRPPEVLYRVRDGRPSLYLLGPRAHDHAALLARHLHALRLPGDGVVDIEGLDLRLDEVVCQLLGKAWQTYDLVTPLFPPRVTWARRPREPGTPERVAWVGATIASGIRAWLDSVGPWLGRGQVDLHVMAHRRSLRDDLRCAWERPTRGQASRVRGFRCRFTANVALPDGIGLGAHKSEGWGEVRRCR